MGSKYYNLGKNLVITRLFPEAINPKGSKVSQRAREETSKDKMSEPMGKIFGQIQCLLVHKKKKTQSTLHSWKSSARENANDQEVGGRRWLV